MIIWWVFRLCVCVCLPRLEGDIGFSVSGVSEVVVSCLVVGTTGPPLQPIAFFYIYIIFLIQCFSKTDQRFKCLGWILSHWMMLEIEWYVLMTKHIKDWFKIVDRLVHLLVFGNYISIWPCISGLFCLLNWLFSIVKS